MLNLDHTYVIRLVEIHKILSQEYYHEILVYYHMSFIISTSNMLKEMFFFYRFLRYPCQRHSRLFFHTPHLPEIGLHIDLEVIGMKKQDQNYLESMEKKRRLVFKE